MRGEGPSNQSLFARTTLPGPEGTVGLHQPLTYWTVPREDIWTANANE